MQLTQKNATDLEDLWNSIPIGRENAATYAELQSAWGVSERWVRKTLHRLSTYDNGDGLILIRSGKGRGFYRTYDRQEIISYRKECLNKGRAHFAPVRKINRILSIDTGQLSFGNGLKEAREERGLTQSQVVECMRDKFPQFDRPLLSKMECGICLPTSAQALELSSLYCCDIDYLLKELI